jgi:quercetin dioxygenase-like cupin family protein
MPGSALADGGLNVDRPTVVTPEQVQGVKTATPGVTRFEAFADEHVWVGRIENAPHQESDWHVHPGHDTFGHVTRGRFFVEFGPDGSERIEVALGDFVLIPKGVVHREGNAGAEPNVGIVVRVGQGPVTVNLDGPDASRTLR